MIIADMTGRNSNVFYEVGYAHAKDKLCVLLTRDANDIPFDLKHQRHIIYKSIQDLKNQLSNDLMVVKGKLEAREPPVTVELKSISGYLEKSKYSAIAEVTVHMDIYNRSNAISLISMECIFILARGGALRKRVKNVCNQMRTPIPKDSKYVIF